MKVLYAVGCVMLGALLAELGWTLVMVAAYDVLGSEVLPWIWVIGVVYAPLVGAIAALVVLLVGRRRHRDPIGHLLASSRRRIASRDWRPG